MLVNCDECKKDFEIKPKEKKVSKDISKVYFVCPYCKTEYLVHHTTKDIKAKQKKIRELAKKVKATKDSKHFNQYQKLKKELKKDFEKLKEKVERHD